MGKKIRKNNLKGNKGKSVYQWCRLLVRADGSSPYSDCRGPGVHTIDSCRLYGICSLTAVVARGE